MVDHRSQGSSEVKRALQETVRLDDGRFGFIITELAPHGVTLRWQCHVCGKTIASERALFIHLDHPIHKSNLRVPKHPANNFTVFANRRNGTPLRDEKKDDEWNVDVLPGEPVPPGMEDIMDSGCQIQKSLDAFKDSPLIGLEYIVELVGKDPGEEPRYACLLCEKRGDPRSVMVHLTSQNHYLKYICCFFRTAGNTLNMLKRTPDIRKGIYVAISKVAEAIERRFGRLKPMSAMAETFAAKKFEILKEIEAKDHFRETPELNFMDLVTMDKIRKFALEEEQKHNSQIKKVEVPMIPERNRPGKGPQKGGPPPLTNPPKATPPPLKNPPKATPPPLKTIPTTNPPFNMKTETKNSKNLNQNSNLKNVPIGKLAFQIGKPEKTLGRPKEAPKQEEAKDDDDDVIFIGDNANECIEVRSLSSISSASDNDSLGRDVRRRNRIRSPGFDKRRSPNPRNRRRSPSYTNYRKRSRSRSRDRHHDRRFRRSRSRKRYGDRFSEERDKRAKYSPRRSRERRRSPYQRSRESSLRQSVDKQQIWDRYRAELKKLELEYEEKMKYYEDSPEKHPSYSEEWKNFWNRRYKEVQQSGADPKTYDFKPEWIVCWNKRMKEILEEDLKNKREQLAKDMKVENIREKGPSSDLQDVSPPTPESASFDDMRNTWKAFTGSEISGPKNEKRSPRRSPRRSPSPWEDNNYYKTKKSRYPQNFGVSPPVIHCLRMLSVLENNLGSLGPKVLDLLAKALSLEKIRENESKTILYDPDMHVFFETVKEKIRGQLLAGIVERGLVHSCHSVIGAIDNMLRTYPAKRGSYSKDYSKEYSSKDFSSKPSFSAKLEPVQVAGIGMIDKVAVAQQIAGALIAQGKTDVTQEELEGLINAVVGIAQASNATVNQNTSSIDFFSQLNMKNSTADSHINEILGNMISTAQKNAGVEPEPAEPEKPPEPEPEPEKDENEELKNKLTNFSELTREEQQQLISLLKELESTEPEKVESLRKYVSMGLAKKAQEAPEEPKEKVHKIPSDDDNDDDDYDFEDVYKAASEKVKSKPETIQETSQMSHSSENTQNEFSKIETSNPPEMTNQFFEPPNFGQPNFDQPPIFQPNVFQPNWNLQQNQFMPNPNFNQQFHPPPGNYDYYGNRY